MYSVTVNPGRISWVFLVIILLLGLAAEMKTCAQTRVEGKEFEDIDTELEDHLNTLTYSRDTIEKNSVSFSVAYGRVNTSVFQLSDGTFDFYLPKCEHNFDIIPYSMDQATNDWLFVSTEGKNFIRVTYKYSRDLIKIGDKKLDKPVKLLSICVAFRKNAFMEWTQNVEIYNNN